MRQIRWIALLCGLTALLWMAPAMALQEKVVTLDAAHGLLEPDGEAPSKRAVNLARRWDSDFPGRGGRATYRVTLPPHSGTEPMAVLFSRVGNQARVLINGTTVQRWGVLGNPRFDATKTMRMVTLPAGLLHADRPNELLVEVTIQAQRLGGLSVLRYGPADAIEDLLEGQLLWRDLAMLVFAAGLVGMALLTGALWWRQRDPFYGWFSVAAILGVVRVLDRAWPDVPVPWPLLGPVVAIAYAAHIALMCRFALIAAGSVPRALDRAIDGALLLYALLAILAFAYGWPLLMTLGFALIPLLGLATLATIAHAAWRQRSARAWVLAAAVAGALAAGTHDVLLIRVAGASGASNTYIQHAMFAFVVIMIWFIAERYNRSVANFHALNADLTRRVDERERELRGAFESLREQQHAQSVLNERQRIMREIHDGVGSQLVGLLNMVTQTGTDPAALREQVQLALDEMRMAVDSLQPAHDDLATLLATLRYRLQPRLRAAGIEVVWDVGELPDLQQLSPHAALHVQRILLEAFTNVLKHACASQVTVQISWREHGSVDAPLVSLRIADNGIGLGTDPRSREAQVHGRGLNNMQSRAAAIGAELRVEPSISGGVCIALEWQVERARVTVRG
jgi:signal transduction histidine kinase